MGRSCGATGTVVYGVVIDTPFRPCWPLFLKCLQSVANDDSLAAMAARAIPKKSFQAKKDKDKDDDKVDDDDDDDDNHDSTVLPEPIAKYARATKCLLMNLDDAQDEKEDKDDGDEAWHIDCDDIVAMNYLSNHEQDIAKASKAAFDKVLGPGHGLLLKHYYGHDEDTASDPQLLLQVEATCVSETVNSFDGISVKKIDTNAVGDKEKTDDLIKKALHALDLEAEGGEEPGWILATSCCFFR